MMRFTYYLNTIPKPKPVKFLDLIKYEKVNGTTFEPEVIEKHLNPEEIVEVSKSRKESASESPHDRTLKTIGQALRVYLKQKKLNKLKVSLKSKESEEKGSKYSRKQNIRSTCEHSSSPSETEDLPPISN